MKEMRAPEKIVRFKDISFKGESSKSKPFPRWYLLRTTNYDPGEVSLSLLGGLSQKEKSFFTAKEEVKKAFRADYQKILLSWNFIFHSEIESFIHLMKNDPSHWVLQLHSKYLEPFKKKIKDLNLKNMKIDLIFEGGSQDIFSYLESSSLDFQITLPGYRGFDIREAIASLPERYRSRLYIHFPCFHKKHPQLYSSGEIYEILKEGFYPSPSPPQIDIFNHSIPEELKLEPELEPEFYYQIPSSELTASVIIPSYNSKKELLFTLKHLSYQDLPKENWEVIVVDDGSHDETLKTLEGAEFLSHLNFKYLYFPREKRRRGIGDHRFRAGISRNAGVKQAQGDYLIFLDSDILTPPHYLSFVCKKLNAKDIIQHPRFHLKRRAPNDYKKIIKTRHTFIKGNAYWEHFYSNASNWNEKKNPWKYISTNTLCLKKEIFKRSGWFRKNYTCYGFEDTDLGWRLYQMKYPFHLSDIETYHLYRSSEFFNFHFIKSYLLGQSANIFFHNTHSQKFYEEFRHLIQKKKL